MRKRILAVLLLVVMVVTMVPGLTIAAFAEEDTTVIATEEKETFKLFDGARAIKAIQNTGIVLKNEDAGLDGDVKLSFDITGTKATIYLPGGVDESKLTLSWDGNIKVFVNNEKYASGEAPIPAAGKSVIYRVKKGLSSAYITFKTMKGSEGVKAMFLNLDESMGTIADMNADEAHETSCYGKVAYGKVDEYISIKGRGNSTWRRDKKPYNITFYKKDDFDSKKKVELIDGVKSKKWSLLANFMDNALLRNKVGLDLANDLGIGLETEFVDLYMNGEYLGNYLLTPKNDYQAPDGGYALENDNYVEGEGGDPQFNLDGMVELGEILNVTKTLTIFDGYYNRMTVKNIGDDAADAGVTTDEIETYVSKAWSAVLDRNSEDYQKYFDIDSWGKMYLMYEFCKTYDALAGSILMHRDGLTDSDKLIAGPVWDLDTCMGRVMYKFFVGSTLPSQITAEGWYVDSIGLELVDKPCSILQELGRHQSFRDNLKKIYAENIDAFNNVVPNIKAQSEKNHASALMDFDKWGLLHLSVYIVPIPLTIGTGKYQLHYEPTFSYDPFVNNMIEYAEKRVMWLTDNLLTDEPIVFTEEETTAPVVEEPTIEEATTPEVAPTEPTIQAPVAETPAAPVTPSVIEGTEVEEAPVAEESKTVTISVGDILGAVGGLISSILSK
ncbi:MAG: CotH kinase family protein [Oscillospiraceae bacterium]|nr:CotH kinase family protein [Candidatus Limimonas egerieequi]